jgi:PD-(D/E)XK nuclease superfamily protein
MRAFADVAIASHFESCHPGNGTIGGVMAGTAIAVANGDDLVQKVAALAQSLGLDASTQVKVGRRLWGAVRKIDVVAIHPATRKTLGLECKFQGVVGTAEEKIPATIQDIVAWPIPGLVVFAGPGFSENMRAFLLSTGKAVEFEDLHQWLALFFGLPLGGAAPSNG